MLVQAPRKHPIKPALACTHQQPQRKFITGNVCDDFSLMTWQDSLWSGAFCVFRTLAVLQAGFIQTSLYHNG